MSVTHRDGRTGQLIARVVGLPEGTQFRVRWDDGTEELVHNRELEIAWER